MQEFIILNTDEIRDIINMEDVIEGVEKAYSLKCENLAELFPIVCHSFDGEDSEFDIKSGSMDGAGIFGMKLVSAFYGNDKYNLPRLTGTILLFDRKTGRLKSTMDGGLITNMRTGAAGAVGCKYLARPESETLLLIGTGAQGPVLIDATLRVMKNIKKILVCNPHSPEKTDTFIGTIVEQYKIDIPVEKVNNLEEAVRNADIILTATPSREALIKRKWVKPGTHFSCIGSDMEGKQELDVEILKDASLFCDDLNQAVTVGECEKAYKKGYIEENDITELGYVILGKNQGRKDDKEITVFDSSGIGLQDLMVSKCIAEKAEETGVGTKMRL